MTLGDRTRFPDLAWDVYLDHAAIGPLPDVARAAATRALEVQARQGVAGIAKLVAEAGQVRTQVAALLDTTPEAVALTRNTSDGVLAIAHGTDWHPGDRIVLFRGEFPTNTTPWQVAAELYGLEITWIDVDAFGDGGDGLVQVRHALERGGVRMVSVSAVQFRTGLRMPVAELAGLAHDHGARIFVDAIQAVGAVPVRMDPGRLDYVAFGGQKWCCGPVGTGALVVRPDLWDAMVPRFASWLSHTEPLLFLFEGPGRLTYDRPLQASHALLEGGSIPLSGLAGLAASLGWIRGLGVPAIHAHVQRWHDLAEPQLLDLGFRSHRAAHPDRRSGILSLDPPTGHTAADLAAGLADHGIKVSTPDGALRLSPHAPNALDEVPRVIAAVRKVLGR